MSRNTETRIAHGVVNALLAAGYTVGINDGEETTVRRSTDRTEIFEAMRTTGEDRVLAYEADSGRYVGWVLLIWGNGEDLISDLTVNLNHVIDLVIPES